jgi:hypothetical protein
VLDARFRDGAVYLPAAGALVFADLHVGMADASGVAFPLGERSDTETRLRELCAAFAPDEVVVAGDVLHRFDYVPDAAARTLETIAAAVRDAGARPVLVRGNHDTALGSTWDGPLHDEYVLDDGTLVCHGHAHPDGEAPLYVLGHDHPMVTIEGVRHPCFLYGASVYRGSDVLMLPAFTRLATGTAVNDRATADFQSPLVADADALRPLVEDADAGETLVFPPLGQFRGML